MTAWTDEQLTAIGTAEELRVSSVRPDGTLNKERIIWVVRDGDDLYVRSVNGRESAWFRGVGKRRQGHIRAGGVEADVSFAEPGHDIDDRLDTAYRAKYRRYPGPVESITSPQARAATLKLLPR